MVWVGAFKVLGILIQKVPFKKIVVWDLGVQGCSSGVDVILTCFWFFVLFGCFVEFGFGRSMLVFVLGFVLVLVLMVRCIVCGLARCVYKLWWFGVLGCFVVGALMLSHSPFGVWCCVGIAVWFSII